VLLSGSSEHIDADSREILHSCMLKILFRLNIYVQARVVLRSLVRGWADCLSLLHGLSREVRCHYMDYKPLRNFLHK